MNIYDDEGELDLEKARAEAGRIEGARNETTARARAHELTIGALLDIAGSLRILAAESAAAMIEGREPTRWGIDDFDDDTTPARAATLAEHVSFGRSPLDWLDVGDLVHRADDDTAVAEVVKVGITEDEPFADLSAAPDYSESVRLFQRDLVLLRGDERPEPPHVSTAEEDAAMIDADDAPELFEGGEPEDVTEGYSDEIDDDFEGDTHTATEDAIAVLKANEAARKAAKKSGSKKEKRA